MQWEDYLLARSWRADTDEPNELPAEHVREYVQSRTIDDGALWVQQGIEQQQRDRTAVQALFSMQSTTTSGRAKEVVKQGLSDRNGTIAFGRVRERFDKTASVAKLTDVFLFQETCTNPKCVPSIKVGSVALVVVLYFCFLSLSLGGSSFVPFSFPLPLPLLLPLLPSSAHNKNTTQHTAHNTPTRHATPRRA